MVFLLSFVAGSYGQVSIGEGTNEDQGMPFDPYFGYSYTQSIYKAGEINSSGNITSLKWYFSGTTLLPNSQGLVVYLGHTTKDAFSSGTDWETAANLTQVYSGGITVSGTGWVTITFTTPFAYNGTSNLVVAVQETTTPYDSSTDDFRNTAVVGNRSIYYRSDTVNTSPATPAGGTVAAFVPNIILGGIQQACVNPSGLRVSNLQDVSTTFSWDTNGTETAWEVLAIPSTAAEPTSATSGVAVTGNAEFPNFPLTAGTNYKFYVRANCGSSFSGWIGPVAFTSQCAPVTAFNESFDASTNLPACWRKVGTTGSAYAQASTASFSAPNNVYFYSGSASDRAVLAFPPVSNANASTHRLKFKARAIYTTGGVVEVGYLTDILDPTTFVSLQSFTTTSATTYDTFIAELGSDPESNNLAFRHSGTPANSVYLDDVVWEPIPTCADVANLAVNGIYSSTANVTWVSNGSETAWQYALGTSTTLNPSTLTPVSVIGNPEVSLATLSAATAYKVWVRSDCGAGDFGAWVGPLNFTTQCNAVTAISENFDLSTTLPACWKKVGINGSAYPTALTGAPSSPNVIYLYNNPPTATAPLSVLALPYVDNAAAGTHRLKFKARAAYTVGGVIEVGYLDNIADETSFISLQSFTLTSTTTFETFIAELGEDALTGNLAFRHTGVPANSVYIDDVAWELLPQCSDIYNLAYLNVTNTSVDLTWATDGIESNWQYAVGGSTVTNPSSLTPVDVIGNPEAFITTLQASTTYKIWVRSDCGGGAYGSWVGPVNFTTQCNEVATFSETFDASTTLPSCFKKVGTAGSAYPQNAGTGAATAPNNIYFYQAVLAMPPVNNAAAATHRLKFKVKSAYTAGGNSIIVGYVTDTNDPASFVPIQTFSATSTSVYDTFSAELGIEPLSNTIAIKHTGVNSVVLDDIVWELLPTCSDVYGIAHESLLSTTTTINWETNGSENAWEYVLGSSTDTAPGSLTAVSVNETSADLSGLNPATTYKIWVRSNCGSGSYGAWIGPFSFTTLCAPVAVNYTQDFSNFPPQCWERAAAGTSTTGPVGTAEGIWAADGFLNAGSTGAVKVNLYYINRIGWMVSPIFDLSTGQKNVSFNYAVTTWGETTPIAMGSDDTVTFLASEDGGNTWSEVVVFNTASNVPNSSQTYTYTPSTTSATVKFAFLATDGTVDDTQDYDFFIDNFKVEATLSTGEFDSNAFTFYPNPVKNTLSLSYNQDISSVAVFNLLGQQVLTQSVNANQAKIDMSTLTAGTYIVKVAAESQVKTIKVIKQ